MREPIRSEARKVLTTRSVWGLLVGTMLVSGLAAWGMVVDLDLAGPVGLSGMPGLQEMMALVPAFVLVFGIRSYTDEVRHGSIVPTLLSSPVRRRVVAAKVVVVGVVAAAFALAAVVAVLGVGSLVLAIDGVAVTLGSLGALAALVARFVGVCLLWSAIGLGVGMVVSHQVAAIVGALVWLFAVEGLVGGLVPDLARFLPGSAGMSALGVVPGDALAPIAGAALLAGWAVAWIALGAGRFERRDIA